MKKHNFHILRSSTIFSALIGLSSIINHGIFEVLQGNNSTHGFFIEAISEQHRFWEYGTENALTLIPNYLLTGIVTIILGIILIIWSQKYLSEKPIKLLLLLFISLTLFGGGIGFIIFWLPVWLWSTKINSTLDWWKGKLSQRKNVLLGRFWRPSLIVTVTSWIMVMQLGIFGYFPGIKDADILMNIVMLFLLSTLIFTNITFISAVSLDINKET